MARVVHVTDEEGKEYSVVVDNIVSVAYEPGEPGEPAVEAKDEVEDDPGEEPSYSNPQGRPPKKGSPAVEAQEAKAGTPDKAHIKLVGGDTLTVVTAATALRNAIGS
jgi:hypothetical protein